MKQMRWCFILLFGILISACAASNATTTAPIPAVSAQQGPATEALQPVAQATSRGDNLVASAPASLKVGDGKPVLIEFFRFT